MSFFSFKLSIHEFGINQLVHYASTLVVFKYPSDILRALSFHVCAASLIVWRLHFLLSRAHHRDNTQTNIAGLQCRSPVGVERAKADKSARVNVLVFGRRSNKLYFG